MSNAVEINIEQRNILKNLENLIGKSIPIVKEIESQKLCAKNEGENILGLNLYRTNIKNLPESIGNLTSLEELYLYGNELKKLPKSIGNLSALRVLHLRGNLLSELPESIGNLHNLQELDLQNNRLTLLPETFGKLQSLKALNLVVNQLVRLPESIGNIQTLESIDLLGNRLTNLPESFANLKSLKYAMLYDNPWKGEWKELEAINPREDFLLIFKLCRKLNGITIFISHAWDDQNQYRIIDLEKSLEVGEIIHKVYVCEEDLVGDIWGFMAENVPKSQLLIFIATLNSLKSAACKFELSLAKKYGIKILPIKGIDISWDDLTNINLRKEGHGHVDLLGYEQETLDLSKIEGIEFKLDDFNKLIKEVNKYIDEHISELKLIKKSKGELENEKNNFQNSIKDLMISTEFKNVLKENINVLEKLFQDVSNNRISNKEYLLKLAQILTKKL